jgi:hypothetical protein
MYDAGPFEQQEIASLVAEFYHAIFEAVPGAEKTHWVDDTPFNIVHAPELLTLFPAMRLVHIYRHPLDVLASYRTKAWGGDDVEAIARRLAGVFKQWWSTRERIPAESYFEIGLEKLAENPRENLAEICEFAELPYEKALEEISLDKVNAGRWQRELDSSKVQRVMPILTPILKELGYAVEHE